MNARIPLLAIVIVLIFTLFYPVTARADGIIIPEPIPPCMPPCPEPIPPMQQLDIRYHHVDVTIKDQLVVTHVDQVFYNPNDWQIEGTYVFPIPADAVVSEFVLWVDGKPVQGEVLEAEQARRMYQDIVNTLRDPALLEYIGRGAVQANIFPIPPQGERRIELEYTQALAAENGLVQYVYPLSTEKFSAKPLENVTINVEIESSQPIRAVYSPSHDISITRQGNNHVKAGYEASNVLPDSDFALYYSLGDTEAFHVLTYRDPTDPIEADGFFMVMLAPRLATITLVIPKDVIIVLDQSGSMEGEKFLQAQEALRYILDHLNSGDRFNIISFSTGTQPYAGELRPASEAAEARRWVDTLSAQGSTDINRALLEAASLVETEDERPTYLIFLTDGLPTEGEVDSQKIIDNFHAAATENLRLFAFGVGFDVDTFLLDTLAQENHGASSYVLPDERLDEKISAFYAKISTPVLTDLSLDFGDLAVYDLYPDPLPDLFIGSQIIAVGRYRGGGETDVTLNGVYNNEPQSFEFPGQVFDDRTQANSLTSSIPRLWATRKIGYLLNQVRLSRPDQETIDQIVRLSIRYGIVTPYTSYLVTEEMALGLEAQQRIAEEQYSQMAEAPVVAVSGQEAVQKSADQSAMAGAGSAAAPPAEASNLVKIVGARTFVWSAEKWIDTGFDPDSMQTVKVAFLSEDYFTLSEAHPELAAAFALGEQVIAMSEGTAYEVVAEDVPVEPLAVDTATPEPTTQNLQPTSQTTPEPAEQADETAENLPTEKPAGGNGLCTAGFLPLVLLPLGLIWMRGRKRR
jgi:Ca-activated chloride channel family protein